QPAPRAAETRAVTVTPRPTPAPVNVPPDDAAVERAMQVPEAIREPTVMEVEARPVAHDAPQPPPPAPLVDARPPPPQPAYVWVSGYWRWSGVQFLWIPGYWAPPQAGYVVVHPRWSQRSGGWYF